MVQKKLISYLLIFAYSIGFAHEFIPHTHVEDRFQNHLPFSVDTRHASHLENHRHTTTNDGDDIKHSDHLDDNFYDYIVCLFGGAEHAICFSNNEVDFPSIHISSDDHSGKLIAFSHVLIFGQQANLEDLVKNSLHLDYYHPNNYTNPIVSFASGRAPPSFS